ncbi:hypothetical protein Pden_5028 (plasmid) [Paracoccus denitrificans PD1222]|uniref:Sulfotransferase domain-containing protein n=2 Tax=Paracoccus denitrificans TaxID=266 RepID=A1BC44_PARDP|nr:hypothetical protein Pden_5028 [Paracoccus denitrificans PD1222]
MRSRKGVAKGISSWRISAPPCHSGKPMNLTVHIGTTKTGSSSIQKFLSNNRDILRDRGILVPSSLGRVIHLNAVLSALPFGKSPDLAQTIPLTDAEQHAAFRENTSAAFREEIAGAPGCQEVVITAEQLHSRLPLPDYIQTFRDLFCRDFSTIRIVIYVRPQLDQIISLYSTMLRGGYAHSLGDFIKSRMQPIFRPYFDLRDVITRWADVFGRENVIVRPYKGVARDFGTLGDFCELLKLDLGEEGWQLDKQQVNASINVAGQELLLMLNKTGALDAVQRRKVAKWAEAHCTGRGAMPPLAQAQAFQSQFDEGNAWVTETFFPDHPEYLEPRWPEA